MNTDAQAPRWEQFLREVFEGDQERIKLFQRLIGYSLFGHQDEEIAIFLVGTKGGSNGKTTLTNAIRDTLGDYATSVEEDAITNPKANLAHLQHKRIAFGHFSHTKKIDKEAFRRAVGKDLITRRGLYQTPIQFRSTATLFFETNKKPQTDDPWIRRRCVCVPFNRVFA